MRARRDGLSLQAVLNGLLQSLAATETRGTAKRTAMIAIIISTCLLSDPGVCRDQTIPLDSEISAASCMMKAPPHVAKWSEEHPEWRVVRWRCGAPGRSHI
jgi:hypothetical protein